MKVARVATVPFSLYSYRNHFQLLQSKGVQVTLVTSPDPQIELLKKMKIQEVKGVWISREISPFSDLKSVWQLYLYFKKEKFDIVHSSTPKAGLVTVLAAFFARVPIILHTFTGQRWETLKGLKRFVLRKADQLIGILCTEVFADSPSQAQYLIAEKIIARNKILSLGSGSFGGVDLNRFDVSLKSEAKELKKELSIPSENFVFSFVGRLVKDKGIGELVTAFKFFHQIYPASTLLLIGPFESADPISKEDHELIKTHPGIKALGFVPNPEKYLALSDVFCLPSYREGFGSVILEAACIGIPSIGTNIVGVKDAIINEKTGLLIRPKNAQDLLKAMQKLYIQTEVRLKMGVEARQRVHKEFSDKIVAENLYQKYLSLMERK